MLPQPERETRNMHDKTKDTLATLARWTVEVAAADRYVTALDRALPERQEDDTVYASMSTSFGSSIDLEIYQALAVEDAKPYLAAARRAGFKREGNAEERPNENAVKWKYSVQVDDDHKLELNITLRLKTTSSSGETARCRYVEVGKKEVPDMKLLCGEELAAWEARQAEVSA